jgi:hypothetical protein
MSDLDVRQIHLRLTALIVMKLVRPKAGAKHELLFNKSEAILLNNSLCLAPALGIIKFMIVKEMILVTLCSVT